jgi:integrase
MLPAVAIQLFAGLRRSEIQRLDWSEVDFEGRSIIVSARKAKTRQRWVITIRENLSSWLRPYVRTAGPVAPTIGFRERFDDLIEPFRPWPSNALRHSFGSYLFGLTKNENLVAAEMGNSPGIVFKHYRALVSNKAAKQFWDRWRAGYSQPKRIFLRFVGQSAPVTCEQRTLSTRGRPNASDLQLR